MPEVGKTTMASIPTKRRAENRKKALIKARAKASAFEMLGDWIGRELAHAGSPLCVKCLDAVRAEMKRLLTEQEKASHV